MAKRKYLTGPEQIDLLTALCTAVDRPPHAQGAAAQILRPTPIAPLLRWPGGKSEELKIIRQYMPRTISNYFEPFLGGGAVFLSIDDDVPAYLNDLSEELIDFYAEVATGGIELCRILQQFDLLWKCIEHAVGRERDRLLDVYRTIPPEAVTSFASSINAVCSPFKAEWQGLLTASTRISPERLWPDIIDSVCGKVSRMRKLEMAGSYFSEEDVVNNIIAAVKAAIYYHIRWLYNQFSKARIERPLRAAIFFFIREYSYAAMFRYNSAGEFNVPYGGISYNRKFMTEKIGHFKSPAVGKKLSAARFEKLDFASFLTKFSPESGDFIFADPPYDPDYSAYGRVLFSRDDQQRLADFLLMTPANWMLVIKSTDFIRGLYCDKGVVVREFDKKYVWTIKERNVRDVVHLMVSNY